MKQITFFLAVQVLEENLVFTFSKYLKETMNSNWRKDTEGENSKKNMVKSIIMNISL